MRAKRGKDVLDSCGRGCGKDPSRKYHATKRKLLDVEISTLLAGTGKYEFLESLAGRFNCSVGMDQADNASAKLYSASRKSVARVSQISAVGILLKS